MQRSSSSWIAVLTSPQFSDRPPHHAHADRKHAGFPALSLLPAQSHIPSRSSLAAPTSRLMYWLILASSPASPFSSPRGAVSRITLIGPLGSKGTSTACPPFWPKDTLFYPAFPPLIWGEPFFRYISKKIGWDRHKKRDRPEEKCCLLGIKGAWVGVVKLV